MIGIDVHVDAGDGRHGLGVPVPLLTPTSALIAALDLNHGHDFTLEDGNGPALTQVIWRAEYETSEYHLPWPRLRGAAVLIRGDLFTRLLAEAEGHLLMRDFVVGEMELARDDEIRPRATSRTPLSALAWCGEN